MGFGVRINGVGFSFILLTFFVLCSATDESHIFFSSHETHMLAVKRFKIPSAIKYGLGRGEVENMDPQTLAKTFVEDYYSNKEETLVGTFVEHYYTTFDTNRGGLGNLYQEDSMLTLEGQEIRSTSNIVTKLTSLPFQLHYHSVSTVEQSLKFSQVFHLMPKSQGGGFYVMNDMFRINYA